MNKTNVSDNWSEINKILKQNVRSFSLLDQAPHDISEFFAIQLHMQHRSLRYPMDHYLGVYIEQP